MPIRGIFGDPLQYAVGANETSKVKPKASDIIMFLFLLSSFIDNNNKQASNKAFKTKTKAMFKNLFRSKNKKNFEAMEIAPKKGVDGDNQLVLVDLKLDRRLKPTSVKKYDKQVSGVGSAFNTNSAKFPSQRLADSLIPSVSYAIGSCTQSITNDDDLVYYPIGDLGLFGCVYETWKNHWILRTCPEDWWFTVAKRIAKAVDDAAKPNRWGSEKVRELFVSHQGKETISVELNCYGIEDANYDTLFTAFASGIEQRIKVPEYAAYMQSDFGSSNPLTHTIASQINLMASMQEFFNFEMVCCGCGLRGIEMKGDISDWENLSLKLQRVRETLQPINKHLNLREEWWDHVFYVFQNLILTRKCCPQYNPTVREFWKNILMDTKGTKWIGGGGSMPGKPVDVDAYTGWLIKFVTGEDKILAEVLKSRGDHKDDWKYIKEKLSGWNQVPMKVKLAYCNPVVEDTSTLVAGIVGFKIIHEEEGGGNKKDDDGSNSGNTTESVPSVEPHHMWAMLLPPDSPLRRRGS